MCQDVFAEICAVSQCLAEIIPEIVLYLRRHFIDWSFRGLMATSERLSQFSAAKPFEYVSDETAFRWTGRRPLSHEEVMAVKRSEEKKKLYSTMSLLRFPYFGTVVRTW